MTASDPILKGESVTLRFVLLAAKSLHESGLPAHRLEETLERLCNKLGIYGEFFTTPGSIFASITINEVNQSHMIKVNHSDLNLEKIDAIEDVLDQIMELKITSEDALLELKKIQNRKNRYSSTLMILFFAISTGSAACVFGGGLPEITCAFLIGLGIGGLNTLLFIIPRLDKIFVLLSAIWAVSISTTFGFYFKNFQQDIATICGLILLIPGFSFTVSITEMVNNHLIAGLSRFTNAFITFVMIAIGIAVGTKLIGHAPLIQSNHSWMALPNWKEWLALVFVPLGFVVLFKAKPKDFIWIMLACWCSYFTYKLSVQSLSPPIAVCLASFFLGIVSNIFSRIKNRNGSVMLVPGMILLVPGSLGFFSISHLVNSNIIAGLETALSMLTTSMALVFGIIFSNILIQSKR